MSENKINIDTSANIFKRLSEARNKISVTKSGFNIHKKYYYYLPEDVNKAVNEVCNSTGILDCFDLKYDKELGMYHSVVVLINIDNPAEVIDFVFDIPRAEIHGADGAQNAGGTLTYAKRYSYMNVFNIADNADDLDSDIHVDTTSNKTPRPKPTQEFKKAESQPTQKQDKPKTNTAPNTNGTVRTMSAPQRKFMQTLIDEGKLIVGDVDLDTVSIGVKEASEIITKAKEASVENPHEVNFDDLPF